VLKLRQNFSDESIVASTGNGKTSKYIEMRRFLKELKKLQEKK
jgi:hypothetical protein